MGDLLKDTDDRGAMERFPCPGRKEDIGQEMVASCTPLREVGTEMVSCRRMQRHETGFVEFRFENPQMGRLSIQDDIVVGQPQGFPGP